MTREGRDWTAKLRMQRDALAALEVETRGSTARPSSGEHGLPDFQALQNALGAGRSDAVTLFVFDLPFLDGYDLRDAPLTARARCSNRCSPAAIPHGCATRPISATTSRR